MTLPTAFAFGVFFGVVCTIIITYLSSHPEDRAKLFSRLTDLFKKKP